RPTAKSVLRARSCSIRAQGQRENWANQGLAASQTTADAHGPSPSNPRHPPSRSHLRMSSIYVARQPIFELGRGLYGYELLYRTNAVIDHANRDTAFMSADVIVSALLGIGLHTIAENGVAFVNFSREQLLNESW